MGSIELPRRSAIRVAMAWTFGLVGERMRSQALGEAILAGEFLEFDRVSGGMAAEPTYVAMQRLNARIDDYRRQCATARQELQHMVELSDALRRREDSVVSVRGYELATLFGISDTADDILRLAIALLRYIQEDSADFEMPHLNPMSPIKDVNEELEAEQPSHADVERWAREGRLWGWVAVQTENDRREYEALLDQYPFIRHAMEEQAADIVAELERRRERDGADAAIAWFEESLQKSRNERRDSSGRP